MSQCRLTFKERFSFTSVWLITDTCIRVQDSSRGHWCGPRHASDEVNQFWGVREWWKKLLSWPSRCETRTSPDKLKQQETVRSQSLFRFLSGGLLQEPSLNEITPFKLFKRGELPLTAEASSSICAGCVSVRPSPALSVRAAREALDRSSLHMILLGLFALWADTAAASAWELRAASCQVPHTKPPTLPQLLSDFCHHC